MCFGILHVAGTTDRRRPTQYHFIAMDTHKKGTAGAPLILPCGAWVFYIFRRTGWRFYNGLSRDALTIDRNRGNVNE